MCATVDVVDDNLNNLPKLQDKCICIHTVDGRIVCVFSDGQCSGQARNFLTDIGYVIEYGSVSLSKSFVHTLGRVFHTCFGRQLW